MRFLVVALLLIASTAHAVYLGPKLTAAPSSLSCLPATWDPPDGIDGQSDGTQEFICTASGTVTISSVGVGGGQGFSDATTGSCNGLPTLTNGQTCDVDLEFAYNEGGPYSDTLTVASSADNSPSTASLGPTTVAAAGSGRKQYLAAGRGLVDFAISGTFLLPGAGAYQY